MFNSILPISYYNEIAILDAEHDVSIVQHIETKKIYVKKVMKVYNLDIYKRLFERPVKYVPRIYAMYENDSVLTIIEEYISGETLKELLDIGGPLCEKDVINYIMQLCDILEELHSFNPPIIHRDIKPSNVILTESDQIVLIDLNAAHLYRGDKTRDTVLLGTEEFAAPEQFGFGVSSIATDIYLLGMLMKTLLTNDSDKNANELQFGNLGKVISKCLEIGPNNRYSSVKELKKHLQKISKQ